MTWRSRTRAALLPAALASLFALFLVNGCTDDDPVAPEPPGPVLVEKTVYSSDYLNNRFFRLDLPDEEENGRRIQEGERIDINSIKVFEFKGTGTPLPNEITNVAVYIDSAGFRDWDSIDFANPYTAGRQPARCAPRK